MSTIGGRISILDEDEREREREAEIEREQAKPVSVESFPTGPRYVVPTAGRSPAAGVIPLGGRDYPSRIKMMGRYLLWCGIGIGVFDVALMIVLMIFGVDIYWEPIRVDVAIGTVAIFLTGAGLVMQFVDSTLHGPTDVW